MRRITVKTNSWCQLAPLKDQACANRMLLYFWDSGYYWSAKPCSSKILFCILLNVQSCSGGPSLAPTEGVTALLSSGVKRPGREFDLPTADMNGRICSSAPSIYLGSVDNDGFSVAIALLTLFHLTLRIKTDQQRFFAFSTISRPCSHL